MLMFYLTIETKYYVTVTLGWPDSTVEMDWLLWLCTFYNNQLSELVLVHSFQIIRTITVKLSFMHIILREMCHLSPLISIR